MTLALLQRSRAILEHFAPGFDALLGEIPFAAREAADSPVVGWFKHHGPVSLLINQEAGGLGADAFQAVHVQLALGARSPSLAVASTMHQFSVASLVAIGQNGAGAEGLLLSAIARQRLLLASGFAEGVPGGGILDAGMQAEQTPSGVILSGSKKPCSLGKSMDLLTASYSHISPAGEELMVALIPASAPGISHQPFWQNSALAAAESVEVRLDRVLVDNKMVFSAGLKTQLGEVQTIGFIWFELLISASYLGACLGLVEAVVAQQRWSEHHRVELAAQMQLCLSALEGAALDIQRHPDDLSAVLARLLLVRYGIEQLLASTSDQAHQMLGGLDFIRSTDSSQWMLSCRGLQFHPPAKIAMSKNLDAYLQDASFSIAKGVAA